MDSLVNGVPADSVSVNDRGLAYGDGVFETIAVRRGEALLFDRHMERLHRGCLRLGIPAPQAGQCHDEIERLCAGRTGVAKLIVTRGSGLRGYAAGGNASPNRLVLFSGWEGHPFRAHPEGIRLGVCLTRLSAQERLAGIKHLNRLENVLAASELDAALVQEGIMLDHDGLMVECTRSNIFFIKDSEIHTPSLEHCGVSGVMRDHVLRCARQNGIPVRIRDIHLDEAPEMDEAFVSNCLIGVWPVARLGDKIGFRPQMISAIRDWTTQCTLEN
jgi:4-amino-4-deoxychorismate lyase